MKFKKYLLPITVFILLCLSIAMVFPKNSIGIVSSASVIPDEAIKVGYNVGYDNFIMDLDSFNNKGYGYEIFKKIEEVSDKKFEFVPIEGSLVDAVNNGEVDMAGFVPRTAASQEKVLFSDTPFSKTYVSLMSDDDSIYYGSPDAIDNKTVAVYENHVALPNLDRFCEAYGISVEYLYGSSSDYMDIDADFHITYSGDAFAHQGNNVLDLGVFNVFMITSHEHEGLMEEIDTIFLDIVATEGNFFLELEEKYLADNIEINHRGLMQSEVAVLRERPLEVGYIADYQPISFTNEEGEPDGAMVETLNLFAKRYGFEVNYYPYSLSDPVEDRENYDLLLTIYGDGVQDFVNYQATEDYYKIPMYAQVHTDIQQSSSSYDEMIRNSPKIGMLKYQSIEYGSFLESFPDSEITFYDDLQILLDDFESRKIDLAITTESAATYAEQYLNYEGRSTVHTDLEIPMYFLVSKNISDVYTPIFNVMLDRVSENEYDAIMNNQSNLYFPNQTITLLDFAKERWYYFVIGLLILFILFETYAKIKRIEKQKAIEKAYNTEPVTGFMGPELFRDTTKNLLSTAKSGEYELITFDIDMFKNINTYFSVSKGNDVIVSMADAMKKVFDETSAIISRRTAEQFLILRKVNDGGTLPEICEKYLMPAIKGNLNERYNLTMSFGNVIIDNPQEKITTIIGQAYAARRAGKSEHKTTFITFDEKMKKQYDKKASITFRMEQALKDRDFVVEYQPKIDFKTLRVGGAEALVRWKPKNGDKIYPDEFIPIFEENGFISTLDMYVLDDVCNYIYTNQDKMDIPRISVNLSSYTVLCDDIVDIISKTISKYNLPLDQLELELTESAIEADTERFLTVVKQLKKLGFSISIDDFGAGVSSLNRLSAVEADVLKLDKVFFEFENHEKKSTSIVTDVIAMANHLKMKVVAEGVETAPQALWLKEIGCDYAQGYYFARPMSADDFRELLISKKQYIIEQ